MIDLFTLALTHGLIALAAIRLLSRGELDDEGGAQERPEKPWLKNRQQESAAEGSDA